MIALLLILFAGRPYYVTLYDSGNWYCVNKDIQMILNTLYSPKNAPQGPAQGSFGSQQIQQVIKKYQGQIKWTQAPSTAQRIY